mmetsp:Transcript_41023/g.112896  ORF Transcript_41023/g.112896 Transcript_41023/m.112896 type:complete len:290 (-) Transcript_41023:1495-2364(-)
MRILSSSSANRSSSERRSSCAWPAALFQLLAESDFSLVGESWALALCSTILANCAVDALRSSRACSIMASFPWWAEARDFTTVRNVSSCSEMSSKASLADLLRTTLAWPSDKPPAIHMANSLSSMTSSDAVETRPDCGLGSIGTRLSGGVDSVEPPPSQPLPTVSGGFGAWGPYLAFALLRLKSLWIRKMTPKIIRTKAKSKGPTMLSTPNCFNSSSSLPSSADASHMLGGALNERLISSSRARFVERRKEKAIWNSSETKERQLIPKTGLESTIVLSQCCEVLPITQS